MRPEAGVYTFGERSDLVVVEVDDFDSLAVAQGGHSGQFVVFEVDDPEVGQVVEEVIVKSIDLVVFEI